MGNFVDMSGWKMWEHGVPDSRIIVLKRAKDKRYETNKSLIKVIKYCIKNGFSFKVGFNDNTLVPNKKYIEIPDEWFTHFNPKERDEYFEKSIKLREWLENEK